MTAPRHRCCRAQADQTTLHVCHLELHLGSGPVGMGCLSSVLPLAVLRVPAIEWRLLTIAALLVSWAIADHWLAHECAQRLPMLHPRHATALPCVQCGQALHRKLCQHTAAQHPHSALRDRTRPCDCHVAGRPDGRWARLRPVGATLLVVECACRWQPGALPDHLGSRNILCYLAVPSDALVLGRPSVFFRGGLAIGMFCSFGPCWRPPPPRPNNTGLVIA